MRYIDMKRILLGILLTAIFSAAHASVLVIDNSTPISFYGYNGQPKTITGSEGSGYWGSLFTSSTGIFSATYLGNESSYTNRFSLGEGGTLQESNSLGTTISKQVAPGIVDFSFSDNAGGGHTFYNGQIQTLPFGFAIMEGQNNKYGSFDYLLGFNDSYRGNADYDDYVVGVNFVVAPVSEPKTWAMMLAGIGFLGYSARRRQEYAK
jgi:hypothetical protein